MQFSTVFAAAVLGFTSAVAAQSVTVVNDCASPLYIRQNDNDGGPSSGPFEVNSGASWTADLYSPGAAVLLDVNQDGSSPLTFGYDMGDYNLVYYDLSNVAGNPFVNSQNNLVPSNSSCASFDCAPNAEGCYSSSSQYIEQTCPDGTSFTLTVCAPSS